MKKLFPGGADSPSISGVVSSLTVGFISSVENSLATKKVL